MKLIDIMGQSAAEARANDACCAQAVVVFSTLQATNFSPFSPFFQLLNELESQSYIPESTSVKNTARAVQKIFVTMYVLPLTIKSDTEQHSQHLKCVDNLIFFSHTPIHSALSTLEDNNIFSIAKKTNTKSAMLPTSLMPFLCTNTEQKQCYSISYALSVRRISLTHIQIF